VNHNPLVSQINGIELAILLFNIGTEYNNLCMKGTPAEPFPMWELSCSLQI